MNPDKTHIVFGPPGCGKTTRLLSIVDGLLQDGFSSRHICFVAFTRKAAHEAKERAVQKFQLNGEDLPWFRTLHSLAFIRLGLTKQHIMGIRDYLAIANMLGLHITFKGIEEDGTVSGLSKGDRLFFTENMARTLGITLREYWEKYPNEDIYWHELELLAKTLEQYKESNDKMDFTDVITQFAKDGESPDHRILIVDEAQDLSPLQWKVVDKLANYAEETYIAGDDDQAIFRWAGADVHQFINLPGQREILPQSYRIPSKVQEVASSIITRCSERIEKRWLPRQGDSGNVEYVGSIDQVDMASGTWLLLARNVYLLGAYNDHCMREGFTFTSQLGSPISGPSMEAIRYWEQLRRGESVSVVSLRRVYEFMSTKVGVRYGSKSAVDKLPDAQMVSLNEARSAYGLLTDKIWHVALDKLTPVEVEYFLTALKRGEKLLKEPRIKISTIHGVKGGEAENVVIQTDMAVRTFNEYQETPDDEHRVWYVAVTRAKNRLFIVQPATNRNYPI